MRGGRGGGGGGKDSSALIHFSNARPLAYYFSFTGVVLLKILGRQ